MNLIYSEMQVLAATGRDPSLAISSVAKPRTVNTNSGLEKILYNTAKAARIIGSELHQTGCATSTVGLVAYERDARESIVPDETRRVLRGEGSCTNRVLGKWKHERMLVPKPVAVAPAGCVLGPGIRHTTNSSSIFMAFHTRAIKDQSARDEVLLDDFYKVTMPFFHKMVKEVDLSGIQELEPIEAFHILNEKHRSARWMKEKADNYDKFMKGEMDSISVKRYERCSGFVKDESNVKVVIENGQKVARPRPRMIMVMSDRAVVELANVGLLLRAWKKGPVRQFQIKSFTPDEVAQIVVAHTDRRHVITDMSAFEASLDPFIRKIENFVILSLAERAGFSRCLPLLRRYLFGPRILVTKWGRLHLETRCSGDFWTSDGNGIVNIALNYYVAQNKGIPRFRMIAEGDDGVIPAEMVDCETMGKLGFKFSSDLRGTRPGDCDFLSNRFVRVEGGVYRLLSIAKVFDVFWVKKGVRLRRSKQLWLLRCAANSLHWLSPGHPISFALVNRIGLLTRSSTGFKGDSRYMDTWKDLYRSDKYPRDVKVNEALRASISQGGHGFPPVSIAVQLELEDRINNMAEIYIGRLLDDWDEVEKRTLSDERESLDHRYYEGILQDMTTSGRVAAPRVENVTVKNRKPNSVVR
jgi:hypothetical protein